VLRQILMSLVLAFSASMALNAQAIPVAERVASIQVGVGLSMYQPDYNPGTIKGYSIFGDFDLGRHIGIEGNIHMVNVFTPGGIAENSYLLGPRVGFTRRRFHPYAKALAGIGVFTFEPVSANSKSSSSAHRIYAFGGGLDIRTTRRLNIRALDLEYQRWPGFSSDGLTPLGATVGIAYNF
jgi:hypothetical protein